MIPIDGEEGGVLHEKLFEACLRPPCNLPHLSTKAFSPKLAAEIVEAAGPAPVQSLDVYWGGGGGTAVFLHQKLFQEEHEGQVAVRLVVVRLHFVRKCNSSAAPAAVATAAASEITHNISLLALFRMQDSTVLLSIHHDSCEKTTNITAVLYRFYSCPCCELHTHFTPRELRLHVLLSINESESAPLPLGRIIASCRDTFFKCEWQKGVWWSFSRFFFKSSI